MTVPPPTHRREITLGRLDWRVIFGAALGIALGLALWTIIRLFALPLAVLVLSITVAEALSPVVAWLDRWLPRALSASIVFVLLFVGIGALGYLLVPRLVEQAQQLIAQAPQLANTAQAWLAKRNVISADQLASLAPHWLGRLGAFAVSLPLRLGHALLGILVMFFLALYWLIAAPELGAFVQSFFPAEHRPRIAGLQREMSRAMGGYVRGAAIDAAICGGLAGAALYYFGINYPVLLGVLTALGEMVPVVGPITVAVPAIGVGLLESPTKALVAAAVYTAILQLEGHIIAPNVMSRQTNISQAVVIFAFFAGSVVGGLVGAIAAIPLAGALKVLLIRVVAPGVRRWTGASELLTADGSTV